MPTRTPDGLITLSSDELRQFAVDALLQHVQLHINGKKCTLETVAWFKLDSALSPKMN
jgi:hypothetical protein